MNTVQQVIVRLFCDTDENIWNRVMYAFADEVVLDYSSMTEEPAIVTTPQEIVGSWKQILPGFQETHHQLGNFRVKVLGDKAHVFCYGTAMHYLESEEGNVWTVVGTYDFDLIKIFNEWKIAAMRFNFKFQTGNTLLPQRAIERVLGLNN